MPGFDEYTAPGSFGRFVENCRKQAEETQPEIIPAHAWAFGVACMSFRPKTIEVKIHENGRSIDVTPMTKDQKTNFVLQMDKPTAIAVAKAISYLASMLPDEPYHTDR